MLLAQAEDSLLSGEPGASELLIKEARQKARRRRFVIGMICCSIVAVGVLALMAGGGSPPTLHSLSQRLLTRSDYPTGWNVTRATRQFEAGSTCTGLESKTQLLGDDAVQVRFRHRGGGSLSFEYLARRRATVDAFEKAITPVMTFASCRFSANGHVVESSRQVGTISTPNFGNWSTANLITNVSHGKRSQLGYMFVRKSQFVIVIGYENPGNLDIKELEHLTRVAISRVALLGAT